LRKQNDNPTKVGIGSGIDRKIAKSDSHSLKEPEYYFQASLGAPQACGGFALKMTLWGAPTPTPNKLSSGGLLQNLFPNLTYLD
jgi:hypothetical protein